MMGFLLFLVWFGLQYLSSMGLVEPDRAEVMAWALAEFAALLFLFLIVGVERLKAKKMLAIRTEADKTVFRLLGIWFGACLVSAVIGAAHGNDLGYLVGDLYRFGSLPVVLGLLYFLAKDAASTQKILRGMIGVYGFMVLLDLVRFNAFLREEQERLTTETAHQAGMIAVAVIYLMLFDRLRWVRRSSVVLLLLMMVLLLRAQMLTPLITSLLAMGLFFSFSRKFAVFVGCAVAALGLVAASFYSVSVTPTVPTHIADKLLNAQGSQGPMGSLEALSGSRLGEIISIGEEFANHPASLAFGTGQGSLVNPDPILDPALMTDRYTVEKHYVHSGLIDALYHNGTIAIGAFLALLWHLFGRGRRMYVEGNPFGLFVMVNLMVSVVLLMYDLPFESALPLLALCFSGVSAMGSAPQLASEAKAACRNSRYGRAEARPSEGAKMLRAAR
jgi:hypothetical protein